MQIDIPDDLFNKLDLTPEQLKEILAVSLYQMKKINGVQGGKLTGRSELAFHELLGKYGQVVQYDEADLLDDLDSIRD